MNKAAAFSVATMTAFGLTACADSTGPENVEGSTIEGEWSGHVAIGEEIEIKGISGEDFQRLLRSPLVFDGRRTYDPDSLARDGIVYRGIGWKNL